MARARGLIAASEPWSLSRSFWIRSSSRYVPGLTMIVSPGFAASIAAWIDCPGLT